jgi:NAD(P)-dependent dehydrogenase (short-subunit alcohol dehydrogenase family)
MTSTVNVQSPDTAQRRARVAVITGASSGIGLAAAKALAAQGWRVIGTGRDPTRTATAESQLRTVADATLQPQVIRVDLSLLAEAARAATRIAALTDRIDVLINNAGGTAKECVLTAEGNEATFAGNHLGHFVLTQRLLPLLLVAAADAPAGATRIINVSSKAHEYAPGLDWNDLQMIERFVPMPAYCNAKLANLLFTRGLAERLAASGIVVHAMHPGIVNSNFASYADEATQNYFRAQTGLVTPEDAADTLVWLATAPEPGQSTGGYFHQRQAVPSSEAANDRESMRRLWVESERLAEAAG